VVDRDDESGWLVASWDAPDNGGGITTQGKDLGDLQANVREAVCCHFSKGKAPRTSLRKSSPSPSSGGLTAPLTLRFRRDVVLVLCQTLSLLKAPSNLSAVS